MKPGVSPSDRVSMLGIYGFDKRCSWSPQDDEILRRDWLRGVSIKVIAFNVGKTISAVKHRRALLEMPPRKQPGKAKGQRRHRLSVYLNDHINEAVSRRALDRQQHPSAYLHYLVRRDVGL